MIVVSDASPIIALSNAGLADLLSAVYGEVLVPEAVWDELTAGAHACDQAPSMPGMRVERTGNDCCLQLKCAFRHVRRARLETGDDLHAVPVRPSRGNRFHFEATLVLDEDDITPLNVLYGVPGDDDR